jgi:hypothetical protein
MKAGPKAADGSQIQRQEVEKQGAIGLGSQRDHLSLLASSRFVVDALEIRCLAAEAGAIVDNLAIDLASSEIDEAQSSPRTRARSPHARRRAIS